MWGWDVRTSYNAGAYRRMASMKCFRTTEREANLSIIIALVPGRAVDAIVDLELIARGLHVEVADGGDGHGIVVRAGGFLVPLRHGVQVLRWCCGLLRGLKRIVVGIRVGRGRVHVSLCVVGACIADELR